MAATLLFAIPVADAAADEADETGCRAALSGTGDGWPDSAEGTYSLQVENDFFGSPNDGHYTNGLRASWLSEPHGLPRWWCLLAARVPFIGLSGQARTGLAIGQNMYTPDDTSNALPQSEDRPYAGWTYATYALAVEQRDNELDNLELTLGIVGPQSYAGDTQRWWHHVIGVTRPQGWHNQLRNEPGIVLTYEKKLRQWWQAPPAFPAEMDLTPHAGFSLGNVFTHAKLGLTLRFGYGLKNDYGAPRIRPSLAGSDFFRTPPQGWSAYVFAGTEGRAVARNIFLDGNTFVDSPSVEKKPLVGDIQIGAAVVIGRYRLTYTQIFRTREFEGQPDPDRFGALSLSVNF
ncbi:MAG TPA: lipid A deacylase LpxR family protein [Alphaproteobacteria bacterium]|nr:lipid A deacylase LpxR family protein [Alphaproteobacteria bacterium]